MAFTQPLCQQALLNFEYWPYGVTAGVTSGSIGKLGQTA